jgi:ElaB/YqjD/DUF883 family membrane-anchored ribosome-binding protein
MNNPNGPIGSIGPVADKPPTGGDIAARAADQAIRMSQRAVDALRQGSQELRARAVNASDATAGYVRDEPVKSILIAAAAGALLMALVNLVGRIASRP